MSRACSTCGDRSSRSARFCGHCGALLAAGPSSAPADRPGRRRRRLPRPTRRQWITAAVVVVALAVLAAGIDLGGPADRVAVPSATPRARPRAQQNTLPVPVLTACDGGDEAPCIRWTRVTPAEAPVVADDRLVYVPDDGGSVGALDRRTGSVVWSSQTGTVTGGVASTGAITFRTPGGALVGLDPQTGEQRWERDPSDPAPEVVEHGVLLRLLEPGRVVTIDGRSGQPRWTWSTGGLQQLSLLDGFGTSPVAITNDALLGLDDLEGKQTWTTPVPDLRAAVLSEATRTVVAIDGSGAVAGVNADTGAVAWTSQLALPRDATVRMFARESDGQVIVVIDPPLADDGSRTPRIVGISPESGEVRWVHLYRSTIERRDLVLAGDVLMLVGTQTLGTIAAIDVDTGGIAWQRDLGDATATAAAVGGRVLAISGRGVDLFDARTGSRIAAAEAETSFTGIVDVTTTSATLQTTDGIVEVALP